MASKKIKGTGKALRALREQKGEMEHINQLLSHENAGEIVANLLLAQDAKTMATGLLNARPRNEVVTLVYESAASLLLTLQKDKQHLSKCKVLFSSLDHAKRRYPGKRTVASCNAVDEICVILATTVKGDMFITHSFTILPRPTFSKN